MMSMRPDDPLRPTEEEATEAWAARIRADHDQVDRCREVEDPSDFYGPHAKRFAQDPHRTDEPALDALLSMVEAGDTWLDIGAGGGRYSLPLALKSERVHAVDPSPSMLAALREGAAEHGIGNIDITEGTWPPSDGDLPRADVALMAHVGYDIEGFGAFLDAAEAAVSRRCIVVMRASRSTTPSELLWQGIHGEPRLRLPMLSELLVLLLARGTMPEVTLCDRATWGYESLESLLEAARQMLWLRPGSVKDDRLGRLINERATERDGTWALDWSPVPDGIVSWPPRPATN
jgi:2-polyprenyl-3-methyl-5-hydroxy-6-metoxy-1,4-benzoquinol methylase